MLSKEKKIVYLAHGFMETIGSSKWVNKTRDGYLRRGASVVVVDWGHLNQIQYFQAISNLRTVGRVIGYSILQWGVSFAKVADFSSNFRCFSSRNF